jgi:hypothetical protein
MGSFFALVVSVIEDDTIISGQIQLRDGPTGNAFCTAASLAFGLVTTSLL